MIERANPRLYDLSKAGIARAGADLTRWYAAIMVGASGPSSAAAAEFIVTSLHAPPGVCGRRTETVNPCGGSRIRSDHVRRARGCECGHYPVLCSADRLIVSGVNGCKPAGQGLRRACSRKLSDRPIS